MSETMKIYGASSLANSRDENPDSFPCESIHATSGMSLTHLNAYRNLFSVLSNLPEEEKKRPKIIWHDVVSNSLSNHPTNGTPAMNEHKFIDSVLYLTDLYNIKAWMIINRKDQITNILKKETFIKLKKITVILRMEQILTSRWKVDIHNIHLSHPLELHMVMRVLNCNLRHLLKRKHGNRVKKR